MAGKRRALLVATDSYVDPEVRAAIDDALGHRSPAVREAAVAELARLRPGADLAVAAVIDEALKRAVDDDSRRVGQIARFALEAAAPAAPPVRTQRPPSSEPSRRLTAGAPANGPADAAQTSASPAGPAMPSIFVSYRRTDAPGHAGRLYDRLVDRFGPASVFKDLDSMEPGADFVEVIEETVARCDALVAVIGQGWLTAAQAGRQRLNDPQDWVRLEIANALRRNIRVVPVLVAGAPMPSAADLPEDLQALARRHAVELTETAWTAQVNQLLDGLERAVATASSGAAPQSRDPAVEPQQR